MDTVVVSTRIPKQLAIEMAKVSKEGFLNEADFVRNAIRQAVFELKMDKVRKNYLKHKNSVDAVRKIRHITTKMTDKEYAKWVEENSISMPE